MENEQTREDHDLLREERKARGETRDAYLEAGRDQARKDNAQVRERAEAASQPISGGVDAEYEAEQQARREAGEATLRAEARSRYAGTDESFEQDWPTIREQLINEDLQKDLEHMRRRL